MLEIVVELGFKFNICITFGPHINIYIIYILCCKDNRILGFIKRLAQGFKLIFIFKNFLLCIRTFDFKIRCFVGIRILLATFVRLKLFNESSRVYWFYFPYLTSTAWLDLFLTHLTLKLLQNADNQFLLCFCLYF